MLSDEQLVEAMAEGNQAAFEAFVHRYHRLLVGSVERMLQDPNKAEDVVQEVFIRLIRQLQQGKIPHRVKPWMYRVAINLCRDYWKSASYRSEQQRLDLPERREQSPSVIEIYEHQETRKEVLSSLSKLTQREREIIILRFYQELKLQEIAEVLSLTLSTTKTHLYKALKKLKVDLVDHSKQRKEESKIESTFPRLGRNRGARR
ncbi:RNA polymerase sigma factor [Hazenella coriacea]|uniref:RNA polymerase sigma-70 factor (ECF subfamily) n=1 Tax=Hazenella coriacea TaxID=1179467 RepID=A0A4R3LAB2_9BACL|nr:RNA polymerase sigma factor [Hazenella coriacea]TCS96783.1 RNA polymerase sigma-70 factor (ECF subfamily) [Hazenella coriacea]